MIPETKIVKIEKKQGYHDISVTAESEDCTAYTSFKVTAEEAETMRIGDTVRIIHVPR
jgi:hypothetical protein